MTKKKRVSDLGEFGLIDQLAAILGPAKREDLIVGIGDDAAVWRVGGEYVIATTDMMVEGVHFLAGVAPWEDVGWKALAVNISDIAAMGGAPQFALVTLALPLDTDVEAIEAIYAGLAECAREYGVTIAGGDTVRAKEISITVALLGKAGSRDGEPLLLRRDTARPRDLIAVTGTLGGSAAGLRRLQKGAAPDEPLARLHLRPRPRVSAGAIAARLGVRCGIDISDGLLQDIGHICLRSGVGAVLQAAEMPVEEKVTSFYPGEGVQLACTGGEDYELVLVAPEDRLRDAARVIDSVPITIIGEIVEDRAHRVRLLDDVGKEIRYDRSGWDAFR